jgi:hypothetical protein
MHVPQAIEQNPEAALQTLEDDPSTSVAQITETVLGERRLGVRRAQRSTGAKLLPSWEYDPFLTNRQPVLEIVEAEHHRYAVVEPCIRDLKDRSLVHFRPIPT